MKAMLFARLVNTGLDIYKRITESTPPSTKKLVGTALIAVITYILTVHGGFGLADLEMIADFAIDNYEKLED